MDFDGFEIYALDERKEFYELFAQTESYRTALEIFNELDACDNIEAIRILRVKKVGIRKKIKTESKYS